MELFYFQGSYATLMAIGLIVVGCVLVLVGYCMKQNSRFRDLISKLPQGPRLLPVVGNALDLLGGVDRKCISLNKTCWH